MPFKESYLGGVIRVETTLREEQEDKALNFANDLIKRIMENPINGLMIHMPDSIRHERVRTIFLFNRPVHWRSIVDSVRLDPNQTSLESMILDALNH